MAKKETGKGNRGKGKDVALIIPPNTRWTQLDVVESKAY